MKGDRRSRAKRTGVDDAALSWVHEARVTRDMLAAARALAAPVVRDVPARAVTALVATSAAMGAATAPLLDPRTSVELMRLSTYFFDVRLHDVVDDERTLSSRARLVSRAAHDAGELFVVDTEVHDARGTHVLSWRAGFLLRGARKTVDAPFADALVHGDDVPATDARAVVVDHAFSRYYIAATRDANPLYDDDGAARMAGLPGAILAPRALAFLACAALDDDARARGDTITRFVTSGTRAALLGAPLVVSLGAPRAREDGHREQGTHVVDERGELLAVARGIAA